MRSLVISDIHSNLAALQAVLADAPSFDEVWCLGDVVGYGPDPNECTETVKELSPRCVAGNHDWAAINKLDISDFNPDAMRACLWTRERLSAANWQFLADLGECLIEQGFTIVHGSPRYPIWEYISHPYSAEQNFSYFSTPYCLVGHTHVPLMFRQQTGTQDVEVVVPSIGEPIVLTEGRWIINPGSVGQPRDGDPRASYMLLDIEACTVEYRRVPYDIEVTQRKMKECGLPYRLAMRLTFGW